MRSRRMMVPGLLAAAALATVSPAIAQNSLATQDSASKQPTLPKPMPDLTVPASGTNSSPGGSPHGRRHTHQGRAGHHYARSDRSNELERPALANVELLAPLPYPLPPPHVTVPTPAYPPESFITLFTTPAPPVVCRPVAYDPALPNPHLVDERPVVCAPDNP